LYVADFLNFDSFENKDIISALANINGTYVSQNSDAYRDFREAFRSHFGLIETLLVESGRLPHWNGHKHRLQISIDALGWQLFPDWFEQIYKEIPALLTANHLDGRAKLRLLVCRVAGNIQYLMDAFDFPFEKKSRPLSIGLAKDVAVVAGDRSFMKSNQRSVYEAAAQQAVANDCQDMLLCNQAGMVAESTIANVFILQGNQLLTPPLSDGCVQGVFRQGLLSGAIGFQKFRVAEQSLKPEDIQNAEAVFLGNALRGMRQVDHLLF